MVIAAIYYMYFTDKMIRVNIKIGGDKYVSRIKK